MRYLRLLLFPLSLVYGLVIAFRHWLYDNDWLKRTAVDIPTIVVGNLAVGGTGKSPMVEYLIRLLGDNYRIAVLSRGYGRRTKGYREVQTHDNAALTGDEPLQIKRKFPEITVAVCESRVSGVRQLQQNHDLVLLDDAFQHRSLIPGFSILLFDFTTTWRQPRLLLPAGNYRDLASRRRHADIMVLTKTPEHATAHQKKYVAQKLSSPPIPLLYSQIHYEGLMPLAENGKSLGNVGSNTVALIVTGIANPVPFLTHAKKRFRVADHLAYPDHHRFTERDINKIRTRLEQIEEPQKIVLTTEKDVMRLGQFSNVFAAHDILVYYIPIQTVFDTPDEAVLQSSIDQYMQFAKKARN